MRAIMNLDHINTFEAIKLFLEGNQPIAFSVPGDKQERYTFIRKILVKFSYLTVSKKNKGLLKRFLVKITGYSRSQMTRLIKQYRENSSITWRPSITNGFSKKYLDNDIRLLAKVDELHDTPCGQMVKTLCERAVNVFDDQNYQNIAKISVSHLYNLRASKPYKDQRMHFEKTKPTKVAIGERRKPYPQGQPGYIRIDTVHQGDQDKVKGVYHINAVDEETQFQVVCTVEKISERYLIPILELMLDKFPFKIINFHSDNGSEYINQYVAELLEKLHVEFTKSRSRKSNDNALAESKNASVVRKILGHSHIPQKYAEQINQFNLETVYPYINFHRPCFFPKVIVDKKGKERKIYKQKDMMTPFDKFKSLPDAKKHLKPELTFEILDRLSMEMSDNEAAEKLQKERRKLFKIIFEQDKKYA